LNQPQPFRVLVAVKDERTRIPMEALLKTVKAKSLTVETIDAVLTYLGTPDGVDMVIADEAWSELSIEIVRRASRDRPQGGDAYLVVLINGSDVAAALHAFNAGADGVLRKPLDPVEFLNACLAAQRVSDAAKQHFALEKTVEAHAATVNALAAALKPPPPPKEDPPPAASENQSSSDSPGDAPDSGADPAAPRARNRGVLLGGSDESIGGFTLIEQLQESIRESFLELGIPEKNCDSTLTSGSPRHREFIGWQGAFCPASRQWVDLLLCFSWASIESLSQRISGRKASGDVEGVAAVGSYMSNLQATYKRLFRRADSVNSVLLAQPSAFLRIDWIGESGLRDESRTYQPGDGELIADFHLAPGAFATKGFPDLRSGDILAESVATPAQQRIPLISRGAVITPERIKKIESHLEPTRNFWVVEPSLLARRLSGEILG